MTERTNKQWEKELKSLLIRQGALTDSDDEDEAGWQIYDEQKQFIRQQIAKAKREAVENISKDLEKWSKYSGMGVATLFDRKYLK